MTPKIDSDQTLLPIIQQFLTRLPSYGFNGDIESSYSSRLTMATDNSVYQTIPQAIIFPRNTTDVQTIFRLAAQSIYQSLTFTARGGGTGTNGQSLTHGVVIDVSRYMQGIIGINLQESWVKVQPGVIKDKLNDYLRPFGFFYAPDTSTSNRATIGGMINTDASGQGSVIYGKTSDHILELTTVLVDGSCLNSQKIPLTEAETLSLEPSLLGKIYQQVLSTCIGYRELIERTYPKLNRFLTGYDLVHALDHDEQKVDLSRLIAGSEGTLGIVTEAKITILPLQPYKSLIVVCYDSFDSALRHAQGLLSAQATSVETVDSKVLALAQQDSIWSKVQPLIPMTEGQALLGINLVEFNAESETDMAAKITFLEQQLTQAIQTQQQGVIGYRHTSQAEEISSLYSMRKKAVGLLGKMRGDKKPIAFVEDTAVPPEKLADFIAEFRAILDQHHLQYGMFGHVDAGVLHVRPALNLIDHTQEALMHQISDEIAQLTLRYGGVFWGEHGRGYRSQYGPDHFGDTLYQELRKIKTLFDANNRLNPGKICTAITADTQTDPIVITPITTSKRAHFDQQIPIHIRQDYQNAMDCNGNGLCFNYDEKAPMCPSYKVTQDRVHSPKGRATLMREWLRLLSTQGQDATVMEANLMAGKGRSWWQKLSKKQEKTTDDFSHEVFASMEGCLACKACTKECPVSVDVPTFRSKFYHLYYDRYRRPIKDYLVASVEHSAALMAKFPRVINFFLKQSWMQTAFKRWVGYVDLPLLSAPSLRQQIPTRFCFKFSELEALSLAERKKTVLIVQDPFTSFYEAHLITTLVKFIEKLNYRVKVLPFHPNGKPQHVKGFLKQFHHTASTTAEFLNNIHDLGITMVGIEPSLVLCYRDEYNTILNDQRGDFQVLLIHEWLKTINLQLQHNEQETFYLLSHCTEKSLLPGSPQDWQIIFSKFGLSLQLLSSGCCGMAGTYGHELVNQKNSNALFDLSWRPYLQQYSTDRLLATGFSCRSQTNRLAQQQLRHPIELLYQYL